MKKIFSHSTMKLNPMLTIWRGRCWSPSGPDDPYEEVYCRVKSSTETQAPDPTPDRSQPTSQSVSSSHNPSTTQTHTFKQPSVNEWHLLEFIELTFMSVPPWGRCLRAPNGYEPLARLRSERAEIEFSPFSSGTQSSHTDRGSSL